MDNNVIYTLVIILFAATLILTFGYLTDWTFKPSSLKSAKELGCTEPSDELLEKYPNAILFKANFERTGCIPAQCKFGYELRQEECIVTPLTYVNCYDYILSGFVIDVEDLFFLQDGITKMDINETDKLSLFEELRSGDLKEISQNLINEKYGFISAHKSGTPAKKISDYRYLAIKNNEIKVTNEKPEDNHIHKSLFVTCETDPQKIKSYDDYYMLYSLPEYKKSDAYDKIIESILSEKDRVIPGYKLKDTESEYPVTTLKCTKGNDNIINTRSGLVSLDTCKKKCDNNEDCKSFTYYFQPKYTPTQWDDPENPTYYQQWDRYIDMFGYESYYMNENCYLHNTDTSQAEIHPFANCYEK